MPRADSLALQRHRTLDYLGASKLENVWNSYVSGLKRRKPFRSWFLSSLISTLPYRYVGNPYDFRCRCFSKSEHIKFIFIT